MFSFGHEDFNFGVNYPKPHSKFKHTKMPRLSPETCKKMTTLTVLIVRKWSCGYKTFSVSIHSVYLISFTAEECVRTIHVFFSVYVKDFWENTDVVQTTRPSEKERDRRQDV